MSGAAIYPSSDTFIVDGLTLYGIPDRSSLTSAQQTIVRGICSWWLDGSIDLINRSYGFTFNEEGTANHRMRLVFDDTDELWKAAVHHTTDGSIVELAVNMHYFNDIRGIDTSANRRPLLIQYANDGNALIDMLTNEEPDDPYVDYAGGYIALRYMAKQFGGETFDYDEYRQKIKGDDIIFNDGRLRLDQRLLRAEGYFTVGGRSIDGD